MSADETELTFVRCPGCRSLVPAVATRCRMCGEVLHSGNLDAADDTAGDSIANRSRVRQRTISATEAEVGALTGKGSALSPTETAAEPFQARASSVTFDRDPREPNVDFDLDFRREDQRIEDQDLNVDDDDLFGEEEALLPEEDLDHGEDTLEASRGVSRFDELSGDPGGPGTAESRSKRRRRRRKKKKLFGDPMAQGMHGGGYSGGQSEQLSQSSARGNVSAQGEAGRPREREETAERVTGRTVSPLTRINPTMEGVLVGWFVHYGEDGRGVATEIRSGRCFITRERIKESDLLIADASVSTPQCLISVSLDRGLRVQDLMSESGTFVKRLGENMFQEYNEPVTVRHGDWLRFGDYEVLVSLIATRRS